jgi:hypothetical protein
MSDPLSDRDLQKIVGRCNAAAPGPWHASLEGRDHTSGSDVILTGKKGVEFEVSGATSADYDFIAHARQDIPRLVAEIIRLRQVP